MTGARSKLPQMVQDYGNLRRWYMVRASSFTGSNVLRIRDSGGHRIDGPMGRLISLVVGTRCPGGGGKGAEETKTWK